MSKRSLCVSIFLPLAALIIILLLANMGQVILPFIFAGILAYFLQPFAKLLLKKHIPLIVSVLVVYLVFAFALYMLLFWGVPMLARELTEIAEDIPRLLEQGKGFLQGLSLPPSLTANLGSAEGLMPQSDPENGIAQGLVKAAQVFFAIIFAPLLSYYILRDKDKIRANIIAMLPVSERDEILRIAGDIDRIFRAFFSGYCLLAVIVAILSFVLLSLLRVPYALLLALFLGLCDLIPYFGPFIGAIPAVVVAFLQKPLLALYVIAGILLIQQLESSVLSPRILGSRIGLQPLTVIFVVLFGGFYFGVFGLVFAVPAAAALKLIISYLYCRISRVKA